MVDRLLSEGHTVRVIDNWTTGRLENLAHQKENKNLSIYHMDIRNKEEIEPIFQGVDYVFHFAALADIVPSIQRPQDYYSTNVLGTFQVLECAKEAGIKKLVYAASSSCYGIPDEYPTKETAEIRPQYPYALTKRLGEETVLHWGQVYGLPVVTLRLFNVYGTRSRTSGTYGAVFGVFLAQKLAGKPFTVVGGLRKFLFLISNMVPENYRKDRLLLIPCQQPVGNGFQQCICVSIVFRIPLRDPILIHIIRQIPLEQ